MGCEHAGTRWVSHCIWLHPDVDKILHKSVPSRAMNPPDLKHLRGLAGDEYHGMVFVSRDSSCLLGSQARSGSFNILLGKQKKEPNNAAFQTPANNLVDNWVWVAEGLMEQCRNQNFPYALVSYEFLVQMRNENLRKVFEQLGLDPASYDYKAQCSNQPGPIGWGLPKTNMAEDGNIKYFRNKKQLKNKT